AEAGRGRDRGEVAEHTGRLRIDTLDHLHARRIEADLARQVHRVAHSHSLRIGADRLRRVARLYHAFHEGNLSVMISSLEKLRGTPRDGALLRYSLGLEHAKLGEHARAIEYLREAVKRDPQYSAAWKALGAALRDAGQIAEALQAWKSGIEAAHAK